jgi:hypothetical protein
MFSNSRLGLNPGHDPASQADKPVDIAVQPKSVAVVMAIPADRNSANMDPSHP